MEPSESPTNELKFRPMVVDDIAAVHEIERNSFQTPWSQHAFYQELINNTVAQYIVVEYAGRLIGYGGMWVMIDEAHVTNIAVHEDYRRKKIGVRLLQQLIEVAKYLGAKRMTLEVRVSNETALKLYKKFGFREVGVRKQYYSDKEDALIMWAEFDESSGMETGRNSGLLL